MLCRLTVRTCDAVRQWEVSEWTALAVLASLTAGPRLLDELFQALRRYQPDHRLGDSGREVPDWRDAAGGEMWCLVDIVGSTVVCGGALDAPGTSAAYEPSPGEVVEGFPFLWLDAPRGWLFRNAADGWEGEVEQRGMAGRNASRIDTRVVLYGRPLLEHLVDEALAAASDYLARDEDGRLQLTRDIHARWLMTARDDLGGRTPRQVLLADREFIDRDREHRARQWSRQGFAPPGLSRESDAFRCGGYGTIEVMTYFDLVRALLGKTWELIEKRQRSRVPLIDALELQREWWMGQPYEGSGPMVRELVDQERRRMPIASDGTPFDCDCPICRAEAEGLFGSAPAFMMFDGYHLEMEDMFAFSLVEDYEEWNSMYGSGAAWPGGEGAGATSPGGSEEDESDDAEVRAGDASGEMPGTDDGSVWQSSYVNWNQMARTDTSPAESLFALSFPLAELISDLKDRRDGKPYVTRLNEAYDALRRSVDPIASRSTARHFADVLETACARFPELTPKCADLQSHIDEVVRRLP